MKSIEIKGSARTEVGKKATHELRKNNGVPCVLYGIQKDDTKRKGFDQRWIMRIYDAKLIQSFFLWLLL